MLAAVERGGSVASVAERFEVTERGLHKLIKRLRERGTIEPIKPGPKGPEIVVMDNLSSHKASGVEEALERVGVSVWWLPPYSPDLNPIEKLWSKIKSWPRRAAADTLGGLADAAGDAVRSVIAEECANNFEACGYRT